MKRRALALLALAAVLPACDSGSETILLDAILDGVAPVSPSTSNQLPTFSGRAAPGAHVELFTNPAGSGVPVSTGTASSAGTFAVTVSVAKPSGATFYAFSTPPRAPRSGPSNGIAYACRDGGFQPAILISTGVGPWEAAAGDFNEDGKMDLAAPNDGADNVGVYLGLGDGTFPTTAGPFAVGDGPKAVVAADFNGDGHLDLAVANLGSDSVTILLGDGAAAFAPAAGSPLAAGDGTFCLAVGDLNGDGIPDLAASNISATTVSVFLGAGNGGFAAAPGSPRTVGTSPTALALAQLDGQGGLDLAVICSNSLVVLIGQGDGSFVAAAGSPFATSGSSASMAAADLDGGGAPDLVFTSFGTHQVSVHLGGAFAAAPGSPFASGGNNPANCALLDVDSDGDLDVAVTNSISSTFAILLGNGTGTFGAASTTATGTGPRGVTAADLNGDGLPDLAIAAFGGNQIHVLLSK